MLERVRRSPTPTAEFLYEDPPELKEYAARGDLPMEFWPGDWKGKVDVMRACGDPRDWFRYWWRQEAQNEAWANFCDARLRRKNFFKGFDFNQVMIIGPYGRKKSTLMVLIAKQYFDLGHPVFSNASILFGWGLSHTALYTAMGFMPKCSVLAIDESGASLASRLGHGVAISTYNEMGLNTRKQNCLTMMAGAQDWNVAKSVRASCSEVWRPLDSSSLRIERRRPLGPALEKAVVRPADDPDNFLLGWDVWDDYPYQQNDLIDGEPDEKGFGPPSYTLVAEGEEVRNAFLLNDSFELAHAGAATMTDRDDIKDWLEQYHSRLAEAGLGPPVAGGSLEAKKADLNELVAAELVAMRDEGWSDAYIKASDIAQRLNTTSQKVSPALRDVLPMSSVTRGYRSREIFDWIDEMEETAYAAV